MTNKTCGRCKKEKPVESFSKSKNRKDGLHPICKECVNEDYLKNKKLFQKRSKAYRESNKEKISLKNKKYADSHKKEKAAYDKIYRKKNKEKIAKYKKNWATNQRKNNPIFKIKNNMRRRLNHVLNGNLKCDKTFNLIGCDAEFLKDYLEKQFTGIMSWGNYGSVWHIDHIRPCCSFDLSKESEQRECFHYSNLQPLLQEENLKKGRKWLE